MPSVLAALNQAALYESTTGLRVDVVVITESKYKQILGMGMIELYRWQNNYLFVPVNL